MLYYELPLCPRNDERARTTTALWGRAQGEEDHTMDMGCVKRDMEDLKGEWNMRDVCQTETVDGDEAGHKHIGPT